MSASQITASHKENRYNQDYYLARLPCGGWATTKIAWREYSRHRTYDFTYPAVRAGQTPPLHAFHMI